MMLIPDYLTTNQSEECRSADRASQDPLPHPVFKNLTDAKAETPVLWPPHAKSWLIEKDLDAGRD